MDDQTFTVVITAEGAVLSVDGRTDWTPLANNKNAATGIKIPGQIMHAGERVCYVVGGQIICKPRAEGAFFTVVMSTDGVVDSVDGHKNWNTFDSIKDPLTNVLVPGEVIQFRGLCCYYVGGQIICKAC